MSMPEKELERARQTVETQSREGVQEFRDGFTLRSMLGGLFVAFVMLPGGLFLGLMVGQGIGEAAEWVTILLFAEVARRSFNPLSKQEIYVIYYIAASLTAVLAIERGLAGGPFSELIWRAYTVESPQFQNFAQDVPNWAVPAVGSEALTGRSFWNPAWIIPILLLVLTELCVRMSWIGMGYALFRITSDVERLPFPMAPVAASGATALAEAGKKEESWRWNVFSTGAMVGLVFGFFYISIPVFSSIAFGRSYEIFPIPFADFTKSVENILPTALVGLSFSLGNLLIGFVLPMPIVLGACLASVLCQIVLNPILYKQGLFPSMSLGGAFSTKLSADMDFWISIGIGVNISVGIFGLALVLKYLAINKKEKQLSGVMLSPPRGRGDFSIALSLLVWAVATVTLILTCRWLVPDFPIGIIVFFGLVWSPINSYISARMYGLTGRGVSFPHLREGAVVASRYPKVDIWYAPIPIHDHGWASQRFREVELTGTKITSIIKAEIFMFPLILIASFLFWGFFWGGSPLDGGTYPYAQFFWPYHAQTEAVWKQINLSDTASISTQVIKPNYIFFGTLGGLSVYFLFSLLRLPMLTFYGFAGGIGLWPANTVPQLIGAIIGKKYFARKYGQEKWTSYAPVLLAGFSCGAGLISMTSIAFALLSKSVSTLPY